MLQKGQLWETRPLEFYAKAKELRAKWESSAENKEKVLGQGNTGFNVDWQQCFPALTIMEDNPRGSTIAAKNFPEARRFRLASESRGWGREICGYHGVLWGEQFIGYQVDGTPFPERKMVVPIPATCECHTKRGIQCSDFSPVPRWSGDQCVYLGDYDREREVAMTEHQVYCQWKIIEDIERIFGQQFSDEKAVELARISRAVKPIREEIFKLMAHIPAPLSVKELYSTYVLGGLVKIPMEEMLDFWRSVRDEVKWRCDNNIAAVGTERYRWMEAHPPGYFFLKYYRYMEKYGAVCIGSQYTNYTYAQLEIKPDGSVGDRNYTFVDEYMNPIPQPDGTLHEKIEYCPVFSPDMRLETREDEMRYIVNAAARGSVQHFKQDELYRPYALNEFAKIYKVNGALLPLHRSGVNCTLTRKEQGMRLREDGYSVMHYEMNQGGDNTDLDEKRMLESLDQWMESQGLRRLDD
jgi:benzoyl-CoA reductase subunit B